jgi:Fe-S oxidoreductase
LFNDEFTHFNDAQIGIRAVELLEALGYAVDIPDHLESARTWLSKGLVRRAKGIINENTRRLHTIVSAERPMLGIEPSAILTFRDEAIDLASGELQKQARAMAPHCLMIEEFLAHEADAGRILPGAFHDEERVIKLHGHCFQKALAGTAAAIAALSIPRGFRVEEIPSGCCGMAGSFGYEREHHEVSQQVGELVLFPAVRAAGPETIIVASGTSCRHQIKDGTGHIALHPVEILHAALKGSTGGPPVV